MDIVSLREKAKAQLSIPEWEVVEVAYDLALSSDGGKEKLEPSLAVVSQLLELGLDGVSLAAALLHKLPAEKVTNSSIEARLGAEVARLVEWLRRLGRISLSPSALAQAESLRKMLLTLSEDLRVVYIKLADRVEELRHLVSPPTPRTRLIAQESLDIYAPLANRLGIWQLKRELEDLSFAYLEPAKYRTVEEMVSGSKAYQPGFISQVIR
ncbi:MAG: HD domain-containing protein, partial [Chloroflexota bacterium]